MERPAAGDRSHHSAGGGPSSGPIQGRGTNPNRFALRRAATKTFWPWRKNFNIAAGRKPQLLTTFEHGRGRGGSWGDDVYKAHFFWVKKQVGQAAVPHRWPKTYLVIGIFCSGKGRRFGASPQDNLTIRPL